MPSAFVLAIPIPAFAWMLLRGFRLTSILIGSLAAVALFPGPASAASSIATGIAEPTLTDPRPDVRDTWFDNVQHVRAQLDRVNVNWSATTGNNRPADPTDPADPAYGWTAIDREVREAADRGLDIMFLMNTAPRWAEGNNRPDREQAGSWKPDPEAFGKFGIALATRYSGSYPDPEGGTLPHVDLYEAFNEPNLDFWLSPQYEGDKNTGPGLYRDLNNSLAHGVKSVDPSNKIVGPALAPFGGRTEARKTRTRPMKFIRDVFCLKGRKRPKPTSCPGGERLILDIVSHHPISVTGPPNQKAVNPNDATAGDMPEIRKATRTAEKGNKLLPTGIRRPIWVTEYWWRTKPRSPDGVPPKKQARWVEQSLYIFWKAGVKMAIYNTLRDPQFQPELSFGLYWRDGKAKPSATAFRFPFVANRKSKRKLGIWGQSPATGKLTVQRKKGKHWKTVKRINAQEGKVFKATVKLKSKQTLRATVDGEKSLAWEQKG